MYLDFLHRVSLSDVLLYTTWLHTLNLQNELTAGLWKRNVHILLTSFRPIEVGLVGKVGVGVQSG